LLRISVFILGLATLLLLLAGGCAPKEPAPAETARAAPAVPWPKTPCRFTVEAFLDMGGLSLAKMETLNVREERLNGGHPGEELGYWVVSGRPATCSSGDVALTVLPDCSIHSWKARGGCRIAGLEAAR
jgi:hypothetical protein